MCLLAMGELYEIFTKRFCVSCNIVVIGTATVSSVEAISLNHVICSILICGNKKRTAREKLFFFVLLPVLRRRSGEFHG